MFADYLRDEQGKIIIDEDGFPVPQECGPHYGLTDVSKGTSPVRRSPVTRTQTPLRKIGGSPGFWNDVKGWWTGLKPEYRYGIVGGIGVIGIVIAAVQGKGKGSSVGKV